ncbi:di-trans,poly-cis-decaprenylcistransferase [Candidatus Saccharibacteria bacterium]|nr:di-trans,poly-cis-decaprenylcistransferase [Candidatus Saccharibacteria bacterium]
MTEVLTIPNHIGFILDGNRRWAKKYGLPVYEGHMAGYNAVQEVIRAAFEQGVHFVSVYAFSTENWKRSQDEVNKIMSLMLKLLMSDLHIFIENNIKLVIIGSRDGVDKKILESIDSAESATAHNTAGTLAVCFNYGGQLEIADAVKNIIKTGAKADDITPELISQNIYAPEIPPIDIVVRTSGEQRLSNFMLWRVAYSEMMFIDKLWPDMKVADVTDIIKEFSKRSRRFGG